MNDVERAFAPPAVRARRIEQVKVAFPPAGKREYRWRFSDRTTSSWSSAPNGIVHAPPGAVGLDWREASADPEKPIRLPQFLPSR